MSTSSDTIIYLLDQLTSLGPRIRSRHMFGEYALYCDERVVGLVCDDQLFIKITPAGESLLGQDQQLGSPYPGAKPMFLVGGEVIENKDALCQLVEQTAMLLPLPKPKKRKSL